MSNVCFVSVLLSLFLLIVDWGSSEGGATGLMVVTATHPFAGEQPGDLSFVPGDRITVITKTDSQYDWWEGQLEDGRVGIFPANFVTYWYYSLGVWQKNIWKNQYWVKWVWNVVVLLGVNTPLHEYTCKWINKPSVFHIVNVILEILKHLSDKIHFDIFHKNILTGIFNHFKCFTFNIEVPLFGCFLVQIWITKRQPLGLNEINYSIIIVIISFIIIIIIIYI